MATRDERLEENQRLFRETNERMRASATRLVDTDHKRIPFLCECADGACLERVEATMEQFERAQLDPDQYIILPGHPTIEGEEVVEENDGFTTVRKGHGGLWIS